MTKQLLFNLLILAFSFQACAQSDNPVVEYKLEYLLCKQSIDELKRVPGNKQSGGSTYFLKEDLYTGCASHDAPSNGMYFIDYIVDGKVQKHVGYYYNGMKMREFNFRNGVSHGVHISYYDDGSKYIEEFYLEGNPHGKQYRWRGNRQLWRDAEYDNGLKIYDNEYDQEGKLIEKD